MNWEQAHPGQAAAVVPATLPGGLNTVIKKKLIKSGVVVTDDDSEQAAESRQVRRHVFAGHCMRGNAGSTLDAVHRLGFVRYDATEHLTRARHGSATFDKHYKRAVPPRVLAAAASHPRRSELTADEVLFL